MSGRFYWSCSQNEVRLRKDPAFEAAQFRGHSEERHSTGCLAKSHPPEGDFLELGFSWSFGSLAAFGDGLLFRLVFAQLVGVLGFGMLLGWGFITIW